MSKDEIACYPYRHSAQCLWVVGENKPLFEEFTGRVQPSRDRQNYILEQDGKKLTVEGLEWFASGTL